MNELKKGADINAAIKIKENDVEVSDSETYSFTYSCPDYETTLVHILKKKKKKLARIQILSWCSNRKRPKFDNRKWLL